jgi:crotonobetainyl-CoA:carnitine CoA-transferase CaiB-like acyl-CoA transferase
VGVTGTEAVPSRCGLSVADVSAGMYAYTGILSALLLRDRTGKGTRVEISMLEALAEWMSQPIYYGHYGGKPMRRSGASHATVAPYGPHRAGDGREVIFGLQNDREWAVFCREVLRRPELERDPRFATNGDRVANRPELTRIVEEALSAQTAEEVVALLDRVGIANGRVNDVAAVFAHPQLTARARWRTVGTSGGPMSALLPPANLRGIEPLMGDVPALGQHTEAVLRSLGYGAGDIQALRDQRAI